MQGGNGVPADRSPLDPDGVFPQRLADDRAALAGHAGDLWRLAPEAREGRLRRIATLAHRLGGAAGTFGYPAISESALALEDEILGCPSNAAVSSRQGPIQRAIDALLLALDEGLAAR